MIIRNDSGKLHVLTPLKTFSYSYHEYNTIHEAIADLGPRNVLTMINKASRNIEKESARHKFLKNLRNNKK